MLDSQEDGTQEVINPTNLDERMGTVALLAPMVEKLEAEIRSQEQAARKAEELAAAGRRKLFVEGPSDKLIIEKSLSVFVPDRAPEVDVETIDDGGGWSYVVDMLQGWRSVNKHRAQAPKAAGVVDGDADAANARRGWNRVQENILSARCFQLPAPPHLYAALQAGFGIPLDLEALYDTMTWRWAEEHGHLEKRNRLVDIIPNELNQSILDNETTLTEALEDEWSIYVTNRFSQNAKLTVAQYYRGMLGEDFRVRMGCLEPLVTDIIDYLFE